MQLDIVSDLHIDYWDAKLGTKHAPDRIKHAPLNWKDKPKSDILIIAGDIADDLQMSLDYANKLTQYYQHVLFIEGNHEHMKKYPSLYQHDFIGMMVNFYQNEKLIYLTNNTFIKDNVAFLGCCGWWDFMGEYQDNSKNILSKLLQYFTLENSEKFVTNVLTRAELECKLLHDKLDQLQQNPKIENIVVITHCLPDQKYCDRNLNQTQYNTQLNALLKKKYSKLKTWIFGHTHQQIDIINDDNINLIAHPRGRPEDYNRIEYDVKTIRLNKKLNGKLNSKL